MHVSKFVMSGDTVTTLVHFLFTSWFALFKHHSLLRSLTFHVLLSITFRVLCFKYILAGLT